MIHKQAYQQLQNRICEIMEFHNFQAIFTQEMNAIIGDALNAQRKFNRFCLAILLDR